MQGANCIMPIEILSYFGIDNVIIMWYNVFERLFVNVASR